MLLTLCFVLLVGVLNFALGYFTAVYFGASGTPAKSASGALATTAAPAAAASKTNLANLASALNAATALADAPGSSHVLPAEPGADAADSLAVQIGPLNAARDECQEYCQSLTSLSDELAKSAEAGGAGAPQLAAKAAAVAGQFTPLAQQLRTVTMNLAEEHSELSLVCSSLDLTLSGGEDLCQTVANDPTDPSDAPPEELAAAWQARLGTLGETANAVASQLQEIERVLAAALNS